jgi:pyruvate ferredoxin oxidoreductase alpha subunit
MGNKVALTGDVAAAHAIRQVNPDVIAAFPITPSTEVPMTLASFIADGLMDTDLVTVESEHSAMSACVGASAAGGRVMTITAAQGLALMWEIVYIASSMRLPIVTVIAARALNAPLNIHGDHSDVMGARDAGWIQLFCEDSQEVYDSIIQAIKISENKDVLTPVMVIMDGFNTSHSVEIWEMEEDKKVKEFIGEYTPKYPLLDVSRKITYGAWAPPAEYFEHKVSQLHGLLQSPPVVKKVGEDFGKVFGRNYRIFEAYRLDDADYAIVMMGSVAGTAKDVVDSLREDGIKAGLLKLRMFRPFPVSEMKEVLANVKVVATLDRVISAGAYGSPLFNEIRSALYDVPQRPIVIDYIYGLGGRDTQPKHLKAVYENLQRIAKTGKVERILDFINIRGKWEE